MYSAYAWLGYRQPDFFPSIEEAQQRAREAAERVEAAVVAVIGEGKAVTYDLGGSAGTSEMADAIIARLGR